MIVWIFSIFCCGSYLLSVQPLIITHIPTMASVGENLMLHKAVGKYQALAERLSAIDVPMFEQEIPANVKYKRNNPRNHVLVG